MIKAVSELIDSFEMKCYRWILRVPWTKHRTTQSIRNEFQVKENCLGSYVIGRSQSILDTLKGMAEWDGPPWKARFMGKENKESLQDSGEEL